MNRRLYPVHPVLIVDDEEAILQAVDLTLRSEGINHTIRMKNSLDVMPLLSEQVIEVILLDLSMPEISGEVLLETITEQFPHIPVIVVTGVRDVNIAVNCMKNSAFDYMVKPIESSRLVSGVRRAIELRRLNDENRFLQQLRTEDLEHPGAFSKILTQNKEMKNLFKYTESVAQSPFPLMITGETGVGKELMARAVHDASSPQSTFVSINVAGIDDNTFSDTLFGHVKGAFTGAQSSREGLIAKACGGTLFLDEIGDLKSESQVKLLRLFQENEYFMLGSDMPKIMDTRIIAATNQDLEDRKALGRFRKDLYYRLTTHHIHLPPLRKRLDDLPLLIDFFFTQAAESYGKPKAVWPRELVTLFSNYDFPGNIRELRGLLFNAVSTMESGKLSLKPFKHLICSPDSGAAGKDPYLVDADLAAFSGISKLPSMARTQLLLIREALERTGNNKSMAAEMIGISRQRLARLLNASKK